MMFVSQVTDAAGRIWAVLMQTSGVIRNAALDVELHAREPGATPRVTVIHDPDGGIASYEAGIDAEEIITLRVRTGAVTDRTPATFDHSPNAFNDGRTERWYSDIANSVRYAWNDIKFTPRDSAYERQERINRHYHETGEILE